MEHHSPLYRSVDSEALHLLFCAAMKIFCCLSQYIAALMQYFFVCFCAVADDL